MEASESNTDRIGVGPGSGWLTPQEAAGYLMISDRHLRRLIAGGRIIKHQAYPNASVWISTGDCDRYLQIQSN